MKSKVGLIAVGQAGGNIGIKLQEKGYNVFFINTSEEDLETLETAKFKHHIKGGEGCNKDRNKAKELVIENFEEIFADIDSKIKEEFIYVIFSAGGGTGSGASPMLIDLLIQNAEKKVGAITIIPSEKEPLKTHINAYECFRELADIEGLGSTIVLDNNACENKLSINKDFIEAFDMMMNMPDYRDVRGNIDKAELKEMIETRGMLTITSVEQKESTVANLIETFKTNIYAPLENDKVITYIGLLASSQIELTEIEKEVGRYLDAFQGFAEEQTVCVLAGLSYPFTRLEQIKDKVMASQEAVKRNLQATRENKLKDDINFLDELKGKDNSPSKTNAAKDIFAKYRKK